ncbi:MAG: hypothetical protein WC807_11670 [Hyphomicrobium sp.]|jgi:hypothetical protein
MAIFCARVGAVLYAAWGLFHIFVAWQIYALALAQEGLTQGRLFQLAAYMLIISVFAIVVAVSRNWRNDAVGYWLNLGVVSAADIIWVLVVVAPGYVPLLRGLLPPLVWLLAVIFSTLAYRAAQPR